MKLDLNRVVRTDVKSKFNFYNFLVSLLCFVTSLDWNSFGCLTQVALGNFLIHKLSGLCFFFLLLHRVPRFLVGAPVPLWGCTDL